MKVFTTVAVLLWFSFSLLGQAGNIEALESRIATQKGNDYLQTALELGEAELAAGYPETAAHWADEVLSRTEKQKRQCLCRSRLLSQRQGLASFR
ncbi:MAG: hypothetical protein R2795_00065 [Saprospiraceae bacterium]